MVYHKIIINDNVLVMSLPVVTRSDISMLMCTPLPPFPPSGA